MTDRALQRAIAAMKATPPCRAMGEHHVELGELYERYRRWERDCDACGRLALLAALRVIAKAHMDLHSASPCCVLMVLDAIEEAT